MTSQRLALTLLAALLLAAAAAPAASAAGNDLPRPTQRFGSAAAAAHWQVTRLVPAVDRAEAAERSWNGSTSTCTAGSRSSAELDPVVDLINLHREVVGIPALLGTHAESNRLAQEASLVMEANGRLSHFPDPNWSCWSQDGHDGASSSNLHIGTGLWGQVFGYMVDDGDNNLAVGHRQWLLDPTLARVGVGATSTAGAIRVIGVPTRADSTVRAVPWPAAGPSPVYLVPKRWSLSFRGTEVDLSAASVRVTRDGAEVPVTVHGQNSGYGGYTTITWEMRARDLQPAAVPGPDTTTFGVTVSGVELGGATTAYSYDVVVVPDRFTDDDGGIFEADAIVLASGGVTRGCNSAATRFCPEDTLTRGQLAAMLARALRLPAATRDWFDDDRGSIFEDDIDRLAEAGITRGCNSAGTRYCPDRAITRAEMATFFDRAFGLDAASQDWFVDDGGSPHQEAINRFREARITLGCNPPANDRFCPGDDVTRGQIAAFFVRSDLVTLPG